MDKMHYASLKEELKELVPNLDFESGIFRSFVAYWSLRNSGSLGISNHLNEIKNSNPEEWLSLIESNHKFRTLYGEETARVLIKIIEKNKTNK